MLKDLSKEGNLFKSKLSNLINLNHPLCTLSKEVDWDMLEENFKGLYVLDFGRPGKPIRLMVSLQYLKYTYNLSDEEVVDRWFENPYWQYFSGMEYFQTEFPIDSSSMTRFRKRLESKGMDKLLEETIRAGLRRGLITKRSIERQNADTTVQEKNIAYPTDAKLYFRMREKLVNLSKLEGIELRQSYTFKAKHSLLMQSRYFATRKPKRGAKEVKKLKNYLGRVHRDIERELEFRDELVCERFSKYLHLSTRLLNQERRDKNKLYSLHEPEVCCISKGKRHKKYEFGSKVAFSTTSKEGFVLAALNFKGNPYDGHTLAQTIEQSERLTKIKPKQIFVDRGYRGHNYVGDAEVYIQGSNRNRGAPIRKWLKRRSAIEPEIGHMKVDGRLGKNFLKGVEGDEVNAILCACGHNIRKLLNFLYFLLKKYLHIFGNRIQFFMTKFGFA